MQFHILTLFPEMVENGLQTSILGRAIQKGLIGIHAVNIRDYTQDKHNKVDDYPYGGGAGMLMQAQPVYDAWKAVAKPAEGKKPVRVLFMSPQGKTFSQEMAKELAQKIEEEYGADAQIVLLINEKENAKNIGGILEREFAEWSFSTTKMEISRNAVRKCLGEGKKIFIGCCAAVTEQAALFFKEGEAVLFGVGYSDKVLQNIREERVDGVMAYSMYSMGIYAMKCAVTAVEKDSIEREIQVPCRWITKENMKSEYDFLFPIY